MGRSSPICGYECPVFKVAACVYYMGGNRSAQPIMAALTNGCNRSAKPCVLCIGTTIQQQMNPTETLVPIAMFAMVFGIVYITVSSKHRQRMAMIEKGLDLESLKEREVPFRTLRNGLVLVGVGLGLFFGYLLDSRMPGYGVNGDMGDTPLPYFMMVLLCAGIALIVHHFIVRRKQQG